MKLQNYLTGYIDKTSDGRYAYVNKGEVVGTYATIAELVKANGGSSDNTRRSTKPKRSTQSKETTVEKAATPKAES